MSQGPPEDGFSLIGAASLSYAPANFGDADDVRPTGAALESLGGHRDAIQGIVSQSLTRHLGEAISAQHSPALGPQGSSWRKRLRDIMIKQNDTVLSFLYKPPTEHAMLAPVEAALRRYALREDIDVHSVKPLKALMEDASGADLLQEEVRQIILAKGPSDLHTIKQQFQALLEVYKETGDKILDLENQLRMKIEKMDKLQKRICTVIELQTNEATPELVKSLEHYMSISFRDSKIETIYKSLLYYYQKHYILRENLAVFRSVNQTSEPTCPICITEAVGSVLVPCGHTFCQTCVKRMSLECGICRQKIRERVKMYFA